ncbi:MAG: ABC transporter ATP-binding protein [Candidatus Tectomicrobia bacterium]|nr:ABC transporter ATP-binding protein [Candidatus Tectomicrobia bacterium]
MSEQNTSPRVPPSNGLAVEVRNLRMVYRSARRGSVHSLEDVNLRAREKEFISVVGPSGCGKSTLLRIVAGLLPATQGKVSIFGKPVEGPTSEVGIVFQSAVLLPWRSILDNILLQVEMRHLDRNEYRRRAKELIDLVGIQGFEGKLPFELSGGMQQRAAICRALIHDPPLLLMDEPFGALDALTRELMNQELQRIWLTSGKTVLFITHSIGEAVFLSDRVLVMSQRPGTLRADISIDLPRPRGLSTMEDPRFATLGRGIRELLQAHGGLE